MLLIPALIVNFESGFLISIFSNSRPIPTRPPALPLENYDMAILITLSINVNVMCESKCTALGFLIKVRSGEGLGFWRELS